MVNFLADYPCISINEKALKEINIGLVDVKLWKLWFGGTKTKHGARVGVMLISPLSRQISLAFLLEFPLF